jgi:hypothetical protein
VYFLECTVVQCKDALSIYRNRHGHELSRIWRLSANFTLIQCIKIVSRFFGPRYIGDDFFRAEIYRWRLLAFITGSIDKLLRIRISAETHVLVSGASFPVHGILSISDMDLESKYFYFYHSWDFVPYYVAFWSYDTVRKLMRQTTQKERNIDTVRR